MTFQPNVLQTVLPKHAIFRFNLGCSLLHKLPDISGASLVLGRPVTPPELLRVIVVHTAYGQPSFRLSETISLEFHRSIYIQLFIYRRDVVDLSSKAVGKRNSSVFYSILFAGLFTFIQVPLHHSLILNAQIQHQPLQSKRRVHNRLLSP